MDVFNLLLQLLDDGRLSDSQVRGRRAGAGGGAEAEAEAGLAGLAHSKPV